MLIAGLVIVVIILLVLTAVTFNNINQENVGTDQKTILAALQERGIVLVWRGASRAELLHTAPGQAYQVNQVKSDPEWLHIHVYLSMEAARARAAQIRGDQRVHGMIDWIAPAHFFRCDNLITLYLGDDDKVTRELYALCGPQFAGS